MTSLPAAEPHMKSATAGRRRAAAAVGVVAAGLLTLTACEKPTPLATITVSDISMNAEAVCYNDGKTIQASDLQNCLKDKNLKALTFDPDETVRFGVDPEIADKGWTILLNGQPLTDSSKKTYRTIPGSVFFNQQYGATGNSSTVSVVEGGDDKVTGLWSFKLNKSGS
ncbi:DUF2771 domain-containing protein [Streptomyces sp. NPDC091292]|uniref:DUF2771 domain-containing protein n=1 Tax=Streptomyces sp. NPDC091292 TaxID=3365991 RepID=UPI003800E789